MKGSSSTSALLVAAGLGLVPLVLAAGCGPENMMGSDGGDGTDAAPLPPSLELGTGDAMFEPLVNGENVWVVRGPQGGYHVFGSIRVTGIEAGDPSDLSNPNNPTTEFQVFQGPTRIDVGASSYVQGIDPAPGMPDVYEMIGRFVILAIGDDSELDGVEIRITVTVDDVNGVSLSDERTAIALPHPNNL